VSSGGLAQLVERCLCKAEVRGSSPLASTLLVLAFLLTWQRATPCYALPMGAKTITHRVLRNDSGRILREVQQGQSFIITNNGQPVAALRPMGANPLAGIRHEPRVPGSRFSDIVPEKGSGESALEALLALRGER
jgi:prevent-host-death family protein